MKHVWVASSFPFLPVLNIGGELQIYRSFLSKSFRSIDLTSSYTPPGLTNPELIPLPPVAVKVVAVVCACARCLASESDAAPIWCLAEEELVLVVGA